MKILLVAQRLPAPITDGYNLHNYNYLRQLGERHEVDVIALDEGEFPDELRPYVGEVEAVRCATPQAGGLVRRVLDSFSERSLHHYFAEFEEALRSRVTRGDYDVVWIGGWVMMMYAPIVRAACVPGTVIVADPADDEVRATRIEFEKARGTRSALPRYRDYVRNKRFHKHFFKGADLTLFVSDQDADAARERAPELRVEVIQNGVDGDYFAPQPVAEDPATLVFEGAMTFGPNVEGALHLVREILPRVRAKVEGARALLVGRDPVPEIQALAGPDVEVTGTVPDVRTFVARGTVFACPLLGGTGIKNKILQAWAMEKAVVATTCSVTGLDARDGETLLIADDADSFAAACVELITSPERRRSLGERGRETVIAHHSWKAQAAKLESWMQELVAARQPAAETV